MDYKKLGAAGVLLTLLLSGCGTQAQTQDAAKQSNTTQGAAAQDSTKQDAASTQQTKQDKPPQMNEKERQMMLTFQSLLMMDKADGLAITKEEATPMLTVVQDSITKGELTSDAQAKLTEKLTADQKKYLDDAAAKMKERMDNMKQNGGNGGGQRQGQHQGQGQAQGDANASKPNASTDANAGSGANGQQAQAGQGQGQGQKGTADANGQGGQDRGPRGGGFGGGKNAGQQLVELLQSKLK